MARNIVNDVGLFQAAIICFLLIALSTCGASHCSLPVNGTDGEISSPGYPASYAANLTSCVWTFTDLKEVYIEFEDFNLRPGDNLTIYNGDSRVVGKFSERTDFELVYATGVNIAVELSTVNASWDTGDQPFSFKLKYNSSCTVAPTVSRGYIKSPIYVNGSGRIECTYELSSSMGEDKVVALTFPVVDLQKGTLTIKDGSNSSDPLAEYTDGTVAIGDVISTHSQLTVDLMMATAHAQKGFDAAFSLVDSECSRMIEITKAYTLTSPGYPARYPDNINCRWVVTSPPNTTIMVVFENVVLSDEYDTLTLVDGDSKLSRIMATANKWSHLTGTRQMTSGNNLWLQFLTDEVHHDRGFNLTLIPQAFGGSMVNSGHIALGLKPNATEPVIPVPVPSDDVTYQLVSPEQTQVVVTLDLDETFLYPGSAIACYDGASITDPLIAYFRSDKIFYPVFSSGNRMTVVVSGFIQNGTMTTQFFSASFRSVDNDASLVNSLGSSGSYQLLDNDLLEATWLIHNPAPEGQVALWFDRLALPANATVTVYDDLAPYLLNMTAMFVASPSDIPVIYLSRARVSYYRRYNATKASVPNAERPLLYSASYRKIDARPVNLTSARGQLASPSYPDRYPFNAECTWRIINPELKRIHLAFESFALVSNHEVKVTSRTLHTYNVTVGNETVVVTNVTDKVVGRYTGLTLPPDVIDTGNELWVTFSSKSFGSLTPVVGAGFKAAYELVELGGNVTNSTGGTLGTPGYPKPPPTGSSGVWIISVPQGGAVNGSVNILSFTLALSNFGGKTGRMLEIRDGDSASAVVMPFNLSSPSVGPLLSRKNSLWVKYDQTLQDPSKANGSDVLAFQLKYSTYECPAKQQCDNGVCLHDDWRCNGVDDCGDGSDERNCAKDNSAGGIAPWALGVAIVFTFILAVILTFVALAIYKRVRYPHYNELRDVMTPVPT